ncbi:AMMECR1 domain-containing protein [Morchella snyderi]|nr:AMMECR1 domain-containing protein [Morchella snyderi]
MAAVPQCHFCFETLASHLENRKSLTLAQIEALYKQRSSSTNGVSSNGTANGTHTNGVAATSHPDRPLFVTWNKISRSGSKNLRGCIGTFEAQPLEYGLKSYALTAALDDTRFSPISLKELPSLECGVTLLTDFEAASSSMDWTLGTHGLRISFVYHGRKMGATYLPDVPVEQEWTKEETVASLMRKAGWTGRKEEWEKVKLNVVRYKGTKATVSYVEYRELIDEASEVKRTGGLGDDDDDEEEEDEESEEED